MSVYMNTKVELPGSIIATQLRIIKLRSDIAEIRKQLEDPERKSSTPEGQYLVWCRTARIAMTHKEREKTLLDSWLTEQKKDLGRNNLVLPQSMLEFVSHYESLILVADAAMNYVDSPDEEHDEELLTKLESKVSLVRRILNPKRKRA